MIRTLGCFLLVLLLALRAEAQDPPASAADAAATPAASDQPLDPDQGEEHVCESDLSFTWKRDPVPPPTPVGGAAAAVPEPQPIEAFYTRAGARGQNLAEVKMRLEAKLPALKAEALAECRRQHEDEAGCISSGLRKSAGEYNLLDYAARRTLLQSVIDHCRALRGTCQSATTGEISCYVSRSPDAAPATAEEASKEEKGKDKKKKK